MRLKAIVANDVLPVRRFDVHDLSDVVVLAGPNGVGKTRLIKGILTALQSVVSSSIQFQVEATTEVERLAWGTNILDTSIADQALKLHQTLHKNRSRGNWQSSILHFESDRTIQKIDKFNFTFDFADPWEESIGWNQTFGGLRARFQDTVHSIFRKLHNRRGKIADQVELEIREGREITLAPDAFPDPLLPFKEAFKQLLGPKELVDPDPRKQELQYRIDGQARPLASLSSGEREVVNIVFDFLLRQPSDCIIVFDEPELHLHPELSYKLLQTLRSVGTNNQFIFCTHSPDIITASLENSVVFLAPPTDPPTNQAIVVREDDRTHEALRLLGQSIGIIALGRKLILIEGAQASLDKQVYGAILRNRYPNLVLVPCGGKQTITSFASVAENVLNRTLWGVEFFVLTDRDSLPVGNSVEQMESTGKGRFRVLPRYHIENYFLDEDLLAAIFAKMEPSTSWLCSPTQILARLRAFAEEMKSYAAAMAVSAGLRAEVGNVDLMPGGCHGKTADELALIMVDQSTRERQRVAEVLAPKRITDLVRETTAKLTESLQDSGDSWKFFIPGKPVLHKFANAARIDPGRLKLLYLQEAHQRNSMVFDDVIGIFRAFDALVLER